MEKRIGTIIILIEDREVAPILNSIISEYAECIIGRLGLPSQVHKKSIINLIVEGTTDEVGAFTGKLGRLQGVQVKSAFLKGSDF